MQIEALSTKPEYVTGGDVLVSVRTADGSTDATTVRAGDRDVTAAFTAQNGVLTGLVTGLPDGPTQIVAEHGGDKGTLDVVNHAVTGPLFSGPQLEPVHLQDRLVRAGRRPPTPTARRRRRPSNPTSGEWRPPSRRA